MLRQRTWAIMIRPYFNLRGARIPYTGVPKVGRVSDMGAVGVDTATAISGVGEGGSDGATIPTSGGWVIWYTSTSFKQIRQKYKSALEDMNKDSIMIVETLPTDTLITPLS